MKAKIVITDPHPVYGGETELLTAGKREDIIALAKKHYAENAGLPFGPCPVLVVFDTGEKKQVEGE